MGERCWSTDPSGRHLCQRAGGHDGKHHCSFPGGSEQWIDSEGGTSPAADWTMAERLAPPHECETVADYNQFMDGPRKMWVGRITEPPPGFEWEGYCLHFVSAAKPEIAWCLNEWDIHYLRAATYNLLGEHPNEHWVESIAKTAANAAQPTPDPPAVDDGRADG